MLPAQAKSTLIFLGSLPLVCAFEQGKKEYQGHITADKVITLTNNSSHELLRIHIQVGDEAEKTSSTFRHHSQHC